MSTSNTNAQNNNNNTKMSRKDDPVFNVRFVQLVENHPCLWKSTHPGYSKKEEIQKAWQFVANETKDTVRNCRERWRTIRSSFLRSLKLSRTQTGRGKRKYYLSKYLQFLMPYTKTRLKSGSNLMVLRRLTTSSLGAAETAAALAAAAAVAASGAATTTATTTNISNLAAAMNNTLPHTPTTSTQPPPMTCISNMPLPYSCHAAAAAAVAAAAAAAAAASGDEHTKDSMTSDIAAMAAANAAATTTTSSSAAGGTTTSVDNCSDTLMHDENNARGSIGHSIVVGGGGGVTPRLRAIKLEQGHMAQTQIGPGAAASASHMITNGYLNANVGCGNIVESMQQTLALTKANAAHLLPPTGTPQPMQTNTQLASVSSAVDWAELAEWIKSKKEYHLRCLLSSTNNSPTTAALTVGVNQHNNHHHHLNNSSNNNNNSSSINNNISNNHSGNQQHQQQQPQQLQLTPVMASIQAQPTLLPPTPTPTPDAEQMFLNSLHPFLKEMTGKQNRRFRQKVIALIDAILDDVDV